MPGWRKKSDDHGREARDPTQIPYPGWKDIVIRVSKEIGSDNVGILSAGVAFYTFVAIFPAIAALISVYGLVVDPQIVQDQLSQFADVLPSQAGELIRSQLVEIVSGNSFALSWGLVFSTVLSLWAANAGTKALFRGINIAYGEREKRGFLKVNAITLAITFCGVIVIIGSLFLVAVLPAAINALEVPVGVKTVVGWFKWFVLAALLIFFLAVLYHFAPDRKSPKWSWVSWGSVLAAVLWIAGTAIFSFYVANFGSYNATYGSLAAVVILLFWLYLTSFVILLGAEVNSEIERQTKTDTTVGKDNPMGKRGAHSADELGEAA
ncbi:MAG: YihY/virulence factor BrkB family protein [Chitinispirillaceae bacterium]|nr:YihY/virulence factor BrkB family protein [Chitinispirillaceae bacterium]